MATNCTSEDMRSTRAAADALAWAASALRGERLLARLRRAEDAAADLG